jgi:hypothetical protein
MRRTVKTIALSAASVLVVIACARGADDVPLENIDPGIGTAPSLPAESQPSPSGSADAARAPDAQSSTTDSGKPLPTDPDPVDARVQEARMFSDDGVHRRV